MKTSLPRLCKLIGLIASLLLVNTPALHAAEPTADLFKEGDVVVFLGDSITHVGSYPLQLQMFYATRFPERKIRFHNSGIIGDQAVRARERLVWDVYPYEPTVVSLMLGMNDVGRGLYDPKNSTKPDIEERRQRAITAYQDNMPILADDLTGKGYRLMVATPTPYDQTCASQPDDKHPNLVGTNDALAVCADFVRGMATEKQLGLIEWHAPLTELTLREQATDPSFTLINPDRVHPGGVGHAVMAYYYLMAQGAPQYVSKVVVDARSRRVLEQVNAEVQDLDASATKVSFVCHEKALPFPEPHVTYWGGKDVSAMLELVDFEEDLNQEILAIQGLKAGDYQLSIDGQPMGTYSSEAFAAGINLASNEKTPQYRQAQAVYDLIGEKNLLEIDTVRKAAAKRHAHLRDVDAEDLAAVQAFMEANPKKQKALEPYLEYKRNEQQIADQLREMSDRIYQVNQPVPHEYAITKI